MNKDFEVLDKVIGRVPDFPKKGVLFYDITGVLRHPEAFRYTIERMVDLYKDKNIDAVAGIESRGFVFAAPFAQAMGIPLVLIRKKGKLPEKHIPANMSLNMVLLKLKSTLPTFQKVRIFFWLTILLQPAEL